MDGLKRMEDMLLTVALGQHQNGPMQLVIDGVGLVPVYVVELTKGPTEWRLRLRPAGAMKPARTKSKRKVR